jgi:hypothetical protein
VGLYLERVDQIGFENEAGNEDDWLRADADPSGVTFDRGGLCRLNRADCLALAAWLERTAHKLPVPAEPRKIKRRTGCGWHAGKRATAESVLD